MRLRLLNGSNSRVYRIGLQDGGTFNVIAGDGGLLNAPVPLQRMDLSNAERAEVLLTPTGMEGDGVLLMSFGSELPLTVPGSANILGESSALNGIDFPHAAHPRVAAQRGPGHGQPRRPGERHPAG